jgi:peptide/nickel transport system permease protein
MSAPRPSPIRGVGPTIGAGLLGLFLLCALFGPLLTGSPTAQDLDHLLEAPSRAHLLGTDENGCDLLAQLCHGARLAALVSLSVVGACLVLGTLIGTAAGYLGGLVDEVVMRVIDVLLAFPGILLNLAIVAVARRPGLGILVLALIANGWVGYARVARGQVLGVREREFVQAARVLGAGPLRIIFRHVLPSILSPLIVQATFGFAGVVLVEASLSFLGLGPPVPYTWGALLAQGTSYFWRTQHLLVVPGLAIALLVLGCNLVGDGLRDYLDPRRARI